MSRPRTVRAMAALTMSVGLLAAGQAMAAPVEEETTFFLRADGCGATQEAGRLSTESGMDGSDGCGIIGGPPLDEIVYQAEGAPLFTYEFTTENGVPLVVDAERDVAGVISTQSWTGGVGGVGQVVAEVELVASRIGLNGRPQTVVIGGGTFETTALPTQERYFVPFTLDVPGALQGVELRSLSLTVSVRGANWNAGAQSLNGNSKMTVPTLVETDATTEGQ